MVFSAKIEPTEPLKPSINQSTGTRRVLPSSVQNGCQLEASSLLARGRKLHLPERGNGPVSASDLPEGPYIAARILANVGAW